MRDSYIYVLPKRGPAGDSDIKQWWGLEKVL